MWANAGNLRRRVRSYFTPRSLSDPKAIRIHNQLYSIECLTCTTEIEALLLEIRMIRDFRPMINLQSEVWQERPGSYGLGRNLLILIPVGGETTDLFSQRRRIRSSVGKRSWLRARKTLLNKIQSVFYGAGRKRRREQPEAWESEIVASFFRNGTLELYRADECGICRCPPAAKYDLKEIPTRLAHNVYYANDGQVLRFEFRFSQVRGVSKPPSGIGCFAIGSTCRCPFLMRFGS